MSEKQQDVNPTGCGLIILFTIACMVLCILVNVHFIAKDVKEIKNIEHSNMMKNIEGSVKDGKGP